MEILLYRFRKNFLNVPFIKNNHDLYEVELKMRSIGATVFSKDTTTYEDLYQKSDKSMYKA